MGKSMFGPVMLDDEHVSFSEAKPKFKRGMMEYGGSVHIIKGAYVRWIKGKFTETAHITYVLGCSGRQPTRMVGLPETADVTCNGCRRDASLIGRY